MKLKNSKKKYDLFYVGDHVYFNNTIYRIVYSEGYMGFGYDIFKNKPNWEDDIVAINFEDDFEFIERKRSTLPFNEVFFKGDKTIYFDEYSNRTEVNRFRGDEDNKELALLYVIAKSKDIDVSPFYYFNSTEKSNKTSKTLKDFYAEEFRKEVEKEDIKDSYDFKISSELQNSLESLFEEDDLVQVSDEDIEDWINRIMGHSVQVKKEEKTEKPIESEKQIKSNKQTILKELLEKLKR